MCLPDSNDFLLLAKVGIILVLLGLEAIVLFRHSVIERVDSLWFLALVILLVLLSGEM